MIIDERMTVFIDSMDTPNTEFLNKLEKYSKETNVPIIDITTFFLSRIDYKDFLCDDGVHPNAKGHLLIASAVKDFYEKYYL